MIVPGFAVRSRLAAVAKLAGLARRAPARRRRLRFEPLEDRRLLAFSPELVADVNALPSDASSGPANFVQVGNVTFLTASTPATGIELWKTDGTEAGTVLVKDIFAGSDGSDPQHLTNVNGVLFFRATDVAGDELWKSDGTSAGTVQVKDIFPGAGGSSCSGLTDVNGVLFFSAADDGANFELWKSDGTAAGTVMVKEIAAGGLPSAPASLTNVNGTVFFQAGETLGNVELWKSDGTAAGTVLVKDIFPGLGASRPTRLTNVNGTLFFQANDGINGSELWKSDGTAAGTMLVKDIYPNTPGSLFDDSSVWELTSFQGALFFTASDKTTGYELWKSDGTGAGTVLVKDIRPNGGVLGFLGSSPSMLTPVNNILYFVADDGGGQDLWRSDGTASGTALVKDFAPATGGFTPGYLTNVHGTLFFRTYDNGWRLWKSDGTAAGTVVVKDFTAVENQSNPNPNPALGSLNGTVLLQARDAAHGVELWKSDGTTGGTLLLRDISGGTRGSMPGELVELGGLLYFRAEDGVHGAELWRSDGTVAGTAMVADIFPGARGSNPAGLTVVNGALFFVADDGVNGAELWRSNGTAAGTTLVKDIFPGISPVAPSDLTDVNGTLFFVAYDGTHGRELWKSDGTAAGTMLVTDIVAGGNGAWIRELTNVQGTLFFVTDDQTHGFELWKSDGTAAGTGLVSDIYAGFLSSNPAELTDVDGTLFFRAQTAANGVELWKSDGTAAGTVLVKDIGPAHATPRLLTNVNGRLFFEADDNVHGRELWTSDGTAGGTRLVKDIFPGSFPNLDRLSQFVDVNGTLFFQAADPANGYELWRSDGTPDGTVLVRDLCSGACDSAPEQLTNGNGTLFFQANDAVIGGELWASNGTAAGMLAADVAQPGGSNPMSLTSVGDTLFFVATDDRYGTELWRLPPPPNVSLTVSATTLQGDAGTAVEFTFVRTGPASGSLTVPFGVGGDLAFGSDFSVQGAAAFSADQGAVVFAAGQSRVTLTVTVWADTIVEADEQLLLALVPALDFRADSAPVGFTVANDDTDVTLSLVSPDVLEDGAGNLVYVLTRSGLVDVPLVVDFAVAGTAQLGIDYVVSGARDFSVTAGTVLFAAGEATVTVTIRPVADTDVEGSETVRLQLQSGDGYNAATSAPVSGTMIDDDPNVILSVSPAVLEDGAAGLVYTFVRRSGLNLPLSATFGVSGTAALGTDYTVSGAASFQATTGSVPFAPGESAVQLTVHPVADAVVEPDETVVLTLDPGMATESTAAGIIANDDAPSTLTLENTVTASLENVWLPERRHVADLRFAELVPGSRRLELAGRDAARFEIIGAELVLRAGEVLDFEVRTELLVSIQLIHVALGEVLSTASFIFAITNVNEPPRDLALAGLPVAENVVAAEFGRVSLTDPDAGDMLTLLVSDPRFEVVGGQLRLRSGLSLDFETAATIELTITGRDAGGLEIVRSFTLVVLDVNEAPTEIHFASVPLPENSGGAGVGTVSAVDPDADDTLTLSVDDSRFEIVAGLLRLKAGQTLDYEAEPSLVVVVTVRDAAGLDLTRAFTVIVIDVNERPTDIRLSSVSVAENVTGVEVGTFTVVDPDADAAAMLFLADIRFEIIAGVLRLRAGASLDFETEPAIPLVVTASDAAGEVLVKSFTLLVVNVNEAPTGIDLSSGTVLEESPGAVIGAVIITDPDAGDTFTLAVTDSRLEIMHGELKLRAGVSLDFETQSQLLFTVTARDAGGLELSTAFTVEITDAEDPVFDSDGDGLVDAVENLGPGGGDANRDNQLDSSQPYVATQAGTGIVGITVATVSTTILRNVQFAPHPLPADVPPRADFHVGWLNFTVHQLDSDRELPVTILIDGRSGSNTFYRFGPTPDNPAPHWYRFLFDGRTGAELFADRIVVHFRDGERGDDDLLKNGTLVHAGAPALNLEPHPWQNWPLAVNVNDDDRITALDALTIINELNRLGARALPIPQPFPISRPVYLDVNGDDLVTAADVLHVINDLNALGTRALSTPSALPGFIARSPSEPTAAAIPPAESVRQLSRLSLAEPEPSSMEIHASPMAAVPPTALVSPTPPPLLSIRGSTRPPAATDPTQDWDRIVDAIAAELAEHLAPTGPIREMSARN